MVILLDYNKLIFILSLTLSKSPIVMYEKF